MKFVEIEIKKGYDKIIGINGNVIDTSKLFVTITNKTKTNLHIKKACISIKTKFLFFNISTKDKFNLNINRNLQFESKLNINFDFKSLNNEHDKSKFFTVKIFHNRGISESKQYPIRYII